MRTNTDVELSIRDLFCRFGEAPYDDARRESVSALAHALQCAQLAQWADAAPSLIVAALLHDVGHFIEHDTTSPECDDVHELRAVTFLSTSFGADVVEPVRLHVQAKRYLVATDLSYADTLSRASKHSLRLQGGAMCAPELKLFEQLPYFREAVALRRWDDMAKEPGKRTPDLKHFLGLVHSVRLIETTPQLVVQMPGWSGTPRAVTLSRHVR